MSSPAQPVLILHNVPRAEAAHAESDAGVMDQVRAVAAALGRIGVPYRIAGVRGYEELCAAVDGGDEAIVFNLVEDLRDDPWNMTVVPEVCSCRWRACTGSPTNCLSLTLNKAHTKGLLSGSRLAVPEGILVGPGAPVEADQVLVGPLIVKPVAADASEGIEADGCVFEGFGPGVQQAVERIHQRFAQPALVEQLVGSRELNVSLVRRGRRVEVLGIAEIDFSAFGPDRPRIVDYAAKWRPDTFEYHHTPRIIPAPLSAELAGRVREVSLKAWRAVGCEDYARVDLRADDDGRLWVLEVNANPDISPDAGFAAAVAAAGWSYDEFIANCLRNATTALRRMGPVGGHVEVGRHLIIRRTRKADRKWIMTLLAKTEMFRPNEIKVAAEVLDDALAKGARGHYQSYTAAMGGRPVGWVCFGPTPCTVGTFDLYWIAVDPDHHGRGVGRALMEHTEALIVRRGGRRVVVETAGRPDYEPTRSFYRRLGYREAATVADFYDVGDDKIVYVKRLPIAD